MHKSKMRLIGTLVSAALRSARAIVLTTLLAAHVDWARAADQSPSPSAAVSDWPCRQILVRSISLPAIWSGPPIDGVDWRTDHALSERVAALAARRLPIDAAERAIEDFAKTAGPEKGKILVALFAGLFETLNSERNQIIDGLIRLGRKQKELAGKIRAEAAETHASAQPSSEAEREANPNVAQRLEWDMRLFDERRAALSYVCEAPTAIEQRLFALARSIQNSLD